MWSKLHKYMKHCKVLITKPHAWFYTCIPNCVVWDLFFCCRDTLIYAISANSKGLSDVVDILGEVVHRPLITQEEVRICIYSPPVPCQGIFYLMFCTGRGGRIGIEHESCVWKIVCSNPWSCQTNDLWNWYLSLPSQMLSIIMIRQGLVGSVSGLGGWVMVLTACFLSVAALKVSMSTHCHKSVPVLILL